MFITSSGDYSCNPKYITEALLKEKVNCKIVWSARRTAIEEDQFPKQVKAVDKFTFEYYKELHSSSIVVLNASAILRRPYPKNGKQTVIQTWHGSLGIKRIETKDVKWVNKMRRYNRFTKFIVSNSSFEDDVYKCSYWPDTPILRLGHARNDIFFDSYQNSGDKLKTSILKKYGIKGSPKIILYAPTFREDFKEDDFKLDCYDLDYDALTNAAKERFGGDWIVFTRFHPFIRRRKRLAELKLDTDVIDVSLYPDIQELMCVADMAVTDYSSWIFDYFMTMKPGFIFAVDIEEYNNERGFYYPLETTPFPLAKSNEELSDNIKNFDQDLYAAKVKDFIAEKGCCDDGFASKRVADEIKKIMER
jgi:CDP-glycerol glycerophosphotransferase